jgi:hypothetical protein
MAIYPSDFLVPTILYPAGHGDRHERQQPRGRVRGGLERIRQETWKTGPTLHRRNVLPCLASLRWLGEVSSIWACAFGGLSKSRWSHPPEYLDVQELVEKAWPSVNKMTTICKSDGFRAVRICM